MRRLLSIGSCFWVACFALCGTLQASSQVATLGEESTIIENEMGALKGHHRHSRSSSERGPRGPRGHIGPRGPTGPVGPIDLAVAQSFNPANPGELQIIPAGNSVAALTTVALNLPALGSSGLLSFNAGPESNFTVNPGGAGNYYIGYGLTALANTDLVEDITTESTIMWLCVERTPLVGPAVQLGAVPLSFTHSTQNATIITSGEVLLSASGQMQAALADGDIIKLRVFVKTGEDDIPGAALLIQSNQIVPGTNAINNGGTLTLIRIA